MLLAGHAETERRRVKRDLHFTDRKLRPPLHLVLTSVCYAVDTTSHYDVRSNQSLISTSLRLCEMLCNVLSFYGEELLAPRQNLS